jgi:hypothetical protein
VLSQLLAAPEWIQLKEVMKKPGESVIPLSPGLFSVRSTSCEVKPLVAPHSGIRQNGTSLVRLPLAYTPNGLPAFFCNVLTGDIAKHIMQHRISTMVIVPTILRYQK